MGGSSWLRGGKKRETWLDIAKEEINNETWKVVIAHGSVEFCEAIPIGLVDKSKELFYGRETDRDLLSPCRCTI